MPEFMNLQKGNFQIKLHEFLTDFQDKVKAWRWQQDVGNKIVQEKFSHLAFNKKLVMLKSFILWNVS